MSCHALSEKVLKKGMGFQKDSSLVHCITLRLKANHQVSGKHEKTPQWELTFLLGKQKRTDTATSPFKPIPSLSLFHYKNLFPTI